MPPTRQQVLWTLGAGLATALALAPAAHAAPAITLDRACVNQRQPFGFTGTGFAPGQRVDVRPFTGRGLTFTADLAGNFSGTLTAPLPHADGAPMSVIATDASNSLVDLATTSLDVIRPRVLVLPTKVNAQRAIRVSVRGLTPGQPVYAHVKPFKGPRIRTRRIGVAAGPCGTLSVKTPILRSLRRAGSGAGIVTLQVDQARRASVTQRPAAIAHLIYRRPVRGAGLHRHLMIVMSRGFRDTLQAPGLIP